MPLYTYECEKCDQDWPVAKSVSEIDRVEACPHCESTATARVIKKPPSINKVWAEHYNYAFGKVIKSRAHLAEEMRRHKGETGNEMIELGTEPCHKVGAALDSQRQHRMQKRWEEPAEKCIQEVLGSDIAV